MLGARPANVIAQGKLNMDVLQLWGYWLVT